jgi:hypothetical protein
VGYPEEYISNNQSNNNSHSIPPPPVGLNNPVFMRTGTPVHGLLSRGGGGVSNPLILAGPGRNTPGMDSLGGPGRDSPGGPGRPHDRSSAASSSHALSSGGGRSLSPGDPEERNSSWSHRPLDSEGEEEDHSSRSPPAVQCYSTAVQTVAPSATASLMRQQNRLRNVSLV